MAFETRLQLIKYLDSLIRRKFKGSSSEYSKRLNISNATFFRLLRHIREEYETKIIYNNSEDRYEYEQEGILFFGFLPDNIVSQQALKKYESNRKTENG